MNDGEDDGAGGGKFIGPVRPREFGEQGGNGWNFSGLDAGDDDAGSDAGSTTANIDHDEDGDALMGNSLLDDGPPELEPAGNPFADHHNSDNDMDFTNTDDHTLYSGGRGDDEVLHLEDAGMIGGDAASDATVEMKSPSAEDSERSKFD